MQQERQKRIEAEFYKTEMGNEPVREGLLKLGRPIKTEIGTNIGFVEFNWKIDRPYVDQLRKGNGNWERTIYEVRTHVRVGNTKKEYRTLFFVYDKKMVLTSLFLKATRTTPKMEIDTAWDRMKLWVKEANKQKDEKKKKLKK